MHLFKKIFQKLAGNVSSTQDRSIHVSGDCPILYGLNSPQYHILKFGENNFFPEVYSPSVVRK